MGRWNTYILAGDTLLKLNLFTPVRTYFTHLTHSPSPCAQISFFGAVLGVRNSHFGAGFLVRRREWGLIFEVVVGDVRVRDL